MKFSKTAAAVMAAMLFVMPAGSAYAAESQQPVFEYFNKNDVNGTIVIDLPDDVEAHVEITFDSPEGVGEPYYVTECTGGFEYGFDIEGRDNTADDYRFYNLSISLSKSNSTASPEPFMDRITVPDGNDNPDSYVTYKYTIEADEEYTGKSWDTFSVTDTEKKVLFHFETATLGDVNDDGKVSAIDASMVLSEYAELSSGNEPCFTPKQIAAADIDGNGKTDASDASKILRYYADLSAGDEPSWD